MKWGKKKLRKKELEEGCNQFFPLQIRNSGGLQATKSFWDHRQEKALLNVLHSQERVTQDPQTLNSE